MGILSLIKKVIAFFFFFKADQWAWLQKESDEAQTFQ